MEEAADSKRWLPQGLAASDNPHMGDQFAQVYDMTANRITGPVAVEALRLAGGIHTRMRVLDIAAGAGALSIPRHLAARQSWRSISRQAW